MELKELMRQFADFFTKKDAVKIGTLLDEDFSLFDPTMKWIRGKNAVVEVLKKQFKETKLVKYDVVHSYEEGNVGIMEFKITLDDFELYGVDIFTFDKGKMRELRCYYNTPNLTENASLKPFSDRARSIKPGAIYKHYKGNKYKIISVGRHSELHEENVVYQALYGENDVWIRPLTMFLESVTINGKKQPRFTQELER